MTTYEGSVCRGEEDYLAVPTWLVQYNPDNVRQLERSWESGEDFEYPNVDRHADQIHADDFVIFWASGPGDTAGVVGWGIASGHIEMRLHPRSYQDPASPQVPRKSAEVSIVTLFEHPVITRKQLKTLPEFADFELFQMPNRPNAFSVSPAQWGTLFARFQEVLGR